MIQTTLLTSHKGVDLHAATAVRVMQRRLEGGDALRALYRCDLHTFWGEGDGRRVADLLEVGRFYNPNKHHYGHFEAEGAGHGATWLDGTGRGGDVLPAAWPGRPVASDLEAPADALLERLLGGPVPAEQVAVDVAAFALGEPGPILTGALWRLVLEDDGRDPARLADRLAVTRHGDQGLLVNPHLHGWLVAVRTRT
jgi:hypothetical protein